MSPRKRRMGALMAGLLWAGAAGADAPVAQEEGPVRVTADVVLKVANKETAQHSVIEKAEGLGGYFSALSDGLVTVRVPVGATDELLSHLESLGLVAAKQYQSDDLRERLSDQKTRLEARRKVLEQYFKLLDTANSKAVITVEREITRLVSEVERYAGGIRLLEHDARLARITVRFQFRDRTQPSRRHHSSFDWLNTLSVHGLVYQFSRIEDMDVPRNRVTATPPEGFAAYDARRQHWSASPDGVLYRVRTAKHEPEADLAFWAEAMNKHLEVAGYRIHEESAVKAGEVSGQLIETHAALGPHDYAYSVALFLVGKSLVLVEVAGPVEKYQARRKAVVMAIEAMQL